ncbi:hypothetical protein Lfu02_24520 [Longispora fulva]|uniref:Uncharacterized protein n=1 Tax=Longispora fulva TaxID=619741 RepID=A0A8J7GM66_9ACTN|nr:hypothetical protein [Longispora fulva]MBG6139537.1 hypothetical protein [Longispora fulva]GIG58080.1 hypothetical protein Lfu02_24520 [Longispora fulva]
MNIRAVGGLVAVATLATAVVISAGASSIDETRTNSTTTPYLAAEAPGPMVITVGPPQVAVPKPPVAVERPPAVTVPVPPRVDGAKSRARPPAKVPPVVSVPVVQLPEGAVPVQSPPVRQPVRVDPLGPGSLSPIGFGAPTLVEGVTGRLGLGAAPGVGVAPVSILGVGVTPGTQGVGVVPGRTHLRLGAHSGRPHLGAGGTHLGLESSRAPLCPEHGRQVSPPPTWDQLAPVTHRAGGATYRGGGTGVGAVDAHHVSPPATHQVVRGWRVGPAGR